MQHVGEVIVGMELPHKAKRKSLPVSLRFRIWAMPCAICGDSGDIEIDHIVPLAKGGTNDESNLQPLCHQCHSRKGAKRGRSNDELRELYLADQEEHHLKNRYRMATRYDNPYDGLSYWQWKAKHA